jgi:hypothetical protein
VTLGAAKVIEDGSQPLLDLPLFLEDEFALSKERQLAGGQIRQWIAKPRQTLTLAGPDRTQ